MSSSRSSRTGQEELAAELEMSLPRRVFLQISTLAISLIFRTGDLLVLLPRPRLFRAYLEIWLMGLVRSPYRWPRSFEAIRALKASGQTVRELMYGETPLVTALWLLWRAGLRKGGRLLDLGAGRGYALLAARWLGAEALGVELLEDHVAAVGNALRYAGAELVTGDAGRAELASASHVYLSWGAFAPATRHRLIERLGTCRPGVRIVAVMRPVEGTAFATRSRHRMLFSWGLERVWIQECRGAAGLVQDATREDR